ncbi:MAG TPA: hypothetical protein VN668_15480 [Stellaceae bacterium]|nr:hypothetical protein [Stellaceae bacterium]
MLVDEFRATARSEVKVGETADDFNQISRRPTLRRLHRRFLEYRKSSAKFVESDGGMFVELWQLKGETCLPETAPRLPRESLKRDAELRPPVMGFPPASASPVSPPASATADLSPPLSVEFFGSIAGALTLFAG